MDKHGIFCLGIGAALRDGVERYEKREVRMKKQTKIGFYLTFIGAVSVLFGIYLTFSISFKFTILSYLGTAMFMMGVIILSVRFGKWLDN